MSIKLALIPEGPKLGAALPCEGRAQRGQRSHTSVPRELSLHTSESMYQMADPFHLKRQGQRRGVGGLVAGILYVQFEQPLLRYRRNQDIRSDVL